MGVLHAPPASLRRIRLESVYGGAFLQRQPLVRIFLEEVPEAVHDEWASVAFGLYFAVGRQSPSSPQLNQDYEVARSVG